MMRVQNTYYRDLEKAKEQYPWAKAFDTRGYCIVAYEDPKDYEAKRAKEAAEISEGYKMLWKYGTPHVAFQAHNNDISHLLDLIKSLEAWNDFEPNLVASTVEEFFDKLPKVNYGEGNPNNGNAEFEKIEIKGDTTIIFEAYSLSKFSEDTIKLIEKLVDDYGKRMNADERDLYEEPNTYNDRIMSYSYQIRFWWD